MPRNKTTEKYKINQNKKYFLFVNRLEFNLKEHAEGGSERETFENLERCMKMVWLRCILYFVFVVNALQLDVKNRAFRNA